jgi:hypothetical protein
LRSSARAATIGFHRLPGPHASPSRRPADRPLGDSARVRACSGSPTRIEHRRELRRARFRFLVLLGVLLFVTIFLALSIWEKVQTAFGI